MPLSSTPDLKHHPLNKTFRLIGLAAFASMASMRICDPLLVTLADEFARTPGQASRVIAAFAIAYGVLQLIYGPLGDRFGKLRVICAAAAACSLVCAVTVFATSLEMLVWCRAAMGAAAAGIIPLSMAWLGDQVAYEQRQETLARLLGATVTGMMFGQWFGGFVAATVGWRVAFMVLAVGFGLAAALLWRNAIAGTAPVAGSGGSMLDSVRATLGLLRLPRVRWMLAVTLFEGGLTYGALAFMPTRLIQTFGLSPASAGAAMVLYGLGGLLYSRLARRLLGAMGETGLALGGGAMFAVSLLTLAWTPRLEPAIVSCFTAGLGFYMLHNTLQTQATQMAPQSRGTAVTLFACTLFMGQTLGVLAISAAYDLAALPLAFSVAAVSVVALCGLISRGLRGRLPS